MSDTTDKPGVLASNPTPIAIAATAFVANLCALASLVFSWDAGLTTAVTVTATSGIGFASAVWAYYRTVSKAQLGALQRAVDTGRAIVTDGQIVRPITKPPGG